MIDHAQWRSLGDAVTDSDLEDFRGRICVKPGHIGLAAIGSCSRCAGMTSSCSMSICKRCAESLGVCPYDELLNRCGTASEGDAEKIAACGLALVPRGYSNGRDGAGNALAD